MIPRVLFDPQGGGFYDTDSAPNGVAKKKAVLVMLPVIEAALLRIWGGPKKGSVGATRRGDQSVTDEARIAHAGAWEAVVVVPLFASDEESGKVKFSAPKGSKVLDYGKDAVVVPMTVAARNPQVPVPASPGETEDLATARIAAVAKVRDEILADGEAAAKRIEKEVAKLRPSEPKAVEPSEKKPEVPIGGPVADSGAEAAEVTAKDTEG